MSILLDLNLLETNLNLEISEEISVKYDRIAKELQIQKEKMIEYYEENKIN